MKNVVLVLGGFLGTLALSYAPGAFGSEFSWKEQDALNDAIEELADSGIDLPLRDFVSLSDECGRSGALSCYNRVKYTIETEETRVETAQVFLGTEPVFQWRPMCFHPCYGYYNYQWVQVDVRPVYGSERRRVPHTEQRTEYGDEIHITRLVLERGSKRFNMDSGGEDLTVAGYSATQDDPQARIRYRFPLSLKEAYEFLILHELAHLAGTTSDDAADSFARRGIMELRKKGLGMDYASDLLQLRWKQPDIIDPSLDPVDRETRRTYSCDSRGPSAPLGDAPPSWD